MELISKEILYNYNLRNYLDKNKVCIDEIITKNYQYEICYKKLKHNIIYNLTDSFDIKIYLNCQNEYILNLDDITNIIKRIYNFDDSEIDVMEEYIQKQELDNWSSYPQKRFLWFKLIRIIHYVGSTACDPFYKIEFKIDIDIMSRLLKFRNYLIYFQRNYKNRLYNPDNGIFVQRASKRFELNKNGKILKLKK